MGSIYETLIYTRRSCLPFWILLSHKWNHNWKHWYPNEFWSCRQMSRDIPYTRKLINWKWKNTFHSIDFFKTWQNNNQSTNEVLQFTNINFPTWRLPACSLVVTLKEISENNATSRARSGNLKQLLWKYKNEMKENLSIQNKLDLYSTVKYKTSIASWANVNNLT